MSTPSRQWSAASAATVTEWQQNPRLRYAVYALLAILWLYGVLVLKDVVTQKRQTWQATERRATQARQLAGSGDWAARANEIKASLADAESLLWKEGSLGLSR
ncbi:MAG: hypothetical protein JNM52_04565, partial [Betaproteobacteria bacterium]|nr:hypothetical protein [Betaproteobacteria bacterium]